MASPGTLRVVERQWSVYKRIWRASLASTFLAPVLYLGAMGLGIGSLVDARPQELGAAASYLAFVGPGLLAAAAMQSGAQESAWPVMAGFKWVGFHHAMLSAPLEVRDLVFGHLAWVAVRLAMTSTTFLAVLAVAGVVESPLAVLGLPAAVLTGLAYAAPIAAFALTQDTDQAFSLLFRLGIVPMFLFSGAFFPVEQLPDALEPVARLVPVWHGVQLARGLVLGDLAWLAAAGHVAYLLLWLVAGARWGLHTYTRRLRA